MDILDLLNDDDGSAEWEFEDSDVDDEESSENDAAIAEDEASTEADSDDASETATRLLPIPQRLTGNAYVDGLI
ncbi:hypothetical protein PF008_g28076 [Phytophthora fragariae]|nr:hypothetical protein PF008_g28076 [Phytophthora fragariae]